MTNKTANKPRFVKITVEKRKQILAMSAKKAAAGSAAEIAAD
jgi:hypothetical protein